VPAVPGAFKYSACTGRRRALCVRRAVDSDGREGADGVAQIGINYAGTPNALLGCVNDARNVRNHLLRTCGTAPLLSGAHSEHASRLPPLHQERHRAADRRRGRPALASDAQEHARRDALARPRRVSGRQPVPSLFVSARLLVRGGTLMWPQTRGTARRRKTSTAMKRTGWTRVCGRATPRPVAPGADVPAVIYPCDFKKAGYILDDVRTLGPSSAERS
jgi:hypothetical protein